MQKPLAIGNAETHATAVQAGGGRVQAMATKPLWITRAPLDFLLFVGTPLVILPLVTLGERFWPSVRMYFFVAAFGALGHHLPGMMRAYGDRALFQRFKFRFVVAPVFLVAVCCFFAWRDPELHPVLLVAYLWGVWHGLMQTYGFLRIYDAKVQSFARSTATLDQLMCLSWFGAGVLFSDTRVHHILEAFYMTGGDVISNSMVDGVRAFWGALTTVVTLAFVVNAVRAWRLGTPPSPVKLFLMGTSFAFWWYCNVIVGNLLLGILMFEIFHDVQYLAIVYLFNQKRVATRPEEVDAFTRLFFGRRRLFAFLYVGFVFLYGSLYFVNQQIEMTTPYLGALLASSALLHFYFDGFIWKVREQSIRQGLGLAGGQAAYDRQGLPEWSKHGFRWAILFVLPVALLGMIQARSHADDVTVMQNLADGFPRYSVAQANLAIALYKEGDLQGAVEANRRALALPMPDRDLQYKTENNLMWALAEQAQQELRNGKAESAKSLLREAVRFDTALPNYLNDQGAGLAGKGEHASALLRYQSALLINPDDARVHLNTALSLLALGRVESALQHARRGVAGLPGDRNAQRLLGELEARLGS